MDAEIVRTLRPFSDLKSPTDTIYDHLPYKKDINLVKESDVRLVSGNIVKRMRLVSEETVIINTNPIANDKISRLSETVRNAPDYVVEEYFENELLTEASSEAVKEPIEEIPQPLTPVNSFLGVDEDDEDYSFLND